VGVVVATVTSALQNFVHGEFVDTAEGQTTGIEHVIVSLS
jgi:hypothetical protein